MGSLNLDSPSVQSYLQILQGVITRMATNSAAVKSWCVGFVSAIVVIIADKASAKYIWISVVPIVLFFSLDAYYLGLERLFRGLYNDSICRLHEDGVTVEDAFIVSRGSSPAVLRAAAKATVSFSIWPFYLLLEVMLVPVKAWVL